VITSDVVFAPVIRELFATAAPFSSHWYVNVGPPTAVTFIVTVAPPATVLLAGGTVTTGTPGRNVAGIDVTFPTGFVTTTV
jgi:hypothetical protein